MTVRPPDNTPDWHGEKAKQKRDGEQRRRFVLPYLAGIATILAILIGGWLVLRVVGTSTVVPHTPVAFQTTPSVRIVTLVPRTLLPTETLSPIFPSSTPIVAPTLPPPGLQMTAIGTVRALHLAGRILYGTDSSGSTEPHQINPDGAQQRPLLTDAAPGAQLMRSGYNPLYWSPDGKHAVMAVLDQRRVSAMYIMDADGSNLRKVSEQPIAFGFGWGWSPDSTRIAYSNSQIFVIDTTGMAAPQLAIRAEGIHPVWSPDEKRLAFTRGTSIYSANVDGSDERLLAAGDTASFSPDGRQIAFSTPGANHATNNQDYDIAVMRLDDPASLRVLTHHHAGTQYPRWSPDGQYLVYTLIHGIGDPIEVWVVSVDGTLNWRVTEGTNAYWVL